MTLLDISLPQAQTLAQQHYENFPVAPFFLPKYLREPIALIYTFARVADDIADEGDESDEARLEKLIWMGNQLPDRCSGIPSSPFFQLLNRMIKAHHLPCALFHDLLSAFMQDVNQKNYPTEEKLLDYCKRSANPIGRLLLHLCKQASDKNLKDSDMICTALQLINFAQDWHSDLITRQRIYIPMDDLAAFNVTKQALLNKAETSNRQQVIQKQILRAQHLLTAGSSLGERLSGRFGFTIRLTVLGGLTMIKKLKQRQHCQDRPTLNKLDWLTMVLHALLKKTPRV